MLSYGPILTTKRIDNVPEQYIFKALKCESDECPCKGYKRKYFHDVDIGFSTNIDRNLSYMTYLENNKIMLENIKYLCNETCRVCSFFLINIRNFIDPEAYRIKLANKGGTSNSKEIYDVIEFINNK